VKARNWAGLWSAEGCSDGIMADASMPSMPLVGDGLGTDIDCQTSTSVLSAHWSASDPHSGIARYWYAVGTNPREGDVQGWTDVGTETSVSVSGLSLPGETTYYVTVWADNAAGLHSVMSASDGVKVVTQAAAADFDRDCDVDQADFQHFQGCGSGPFIPQADPNCANADLDGDGDVDQEDFGVFQRCYSGANLPVGALCTD
jgi:hypothetical protein